MSRSLRAKLMSHMRYNKKTGQLIWFMPPRTSDHLRGKPVGYLRTRTKDGSKIYTASFDNRKIDNHLLVWLWHKGEFPKKYIRHKNGVLTDNRIENLEEYSGGIAGYK